MSDTKKGLIIYVGPVEVPANSAASRRILGNVKAFQNAGYEVLIGGAQIGNNDYIFHDGIAVFETGERKHENLPTALKYFAYRNMGKETIAWLNSINQKIDAVILYSGYSPYLLRLLPWCRKKNIPLVFDAVEWYEAPTKMQKWLNPYYWNIELSMLNLIPKTKNVICISSYLQNFYNSKNCNTIIIRPLIDIDEFSEVEKSNIDSILKLSYTGTPGKKDLFNHFIEAIFCLKDENKLTKQIILNIAGISENQLLKYDAFKIRNIVKLPDFIKTLGYVSNKEAWELTASSHFSLLLRNNKRVATAGFPTKIVESLALATPIITNLSSDLGNYLTHKKNSLICQNYTVEELKKRIVEAQNFTNSEYASISENAKSTAIQYFQYSNQPQKLIEFIDNLK